MCLGGGRLKKHKSGLHAGEATGRGRGGEREIISHEQKNRHKKKKCSVLPPKKKHIKENKD